MKADSWRDFIEQRLASEVRGGWLRIWQRARAFTPGMMGCAACAMVVALLSVGWVQLSGYRQQAALNQAIDNEELESQGHAAALRDLRVAGWRQSSGAMTLPAPAQAVVATALASLAARVREEDELFASTQVWVGLSWLSQTAEGHGLVVDHLRRVDSSLSEVQTGDHEPPADPPSAAGAAPGPWLSFDVRLAGTRQALAGFFEALSATAGSVRAVHFTVSAESADGVASTLADLRLQIKSTRLPLPKLAEPTMAGREQASTSAQAALWRDGYMTAWHRLPDGEVARTARRHANHDIMQITRDNKTLTGEAVNQ